MKNHLSRLALPGLMSLILLSPALALADTITTFDVSGTVQNISGGTLDSCANFAICPFSGMFQVDVTTGTYESSGFAITFPGLPTFDTLAANSAPESLVAVNGTGNELLLSFGTEPTPGSLVGFTGGTILGGSDLEGNYRITSGSITPVPEPPSLVLLAGGLGWMVVGLKRRSGKKSAIH